MAATSAAMAPAASRPRLMQQVVKLSTARIQALSIHHLKRMIVLIMAFLLVRPAIHPRVRCCVVKYALSGCR